MNRKLLKSGQGVLPKGLHSSDLQKEGMLQQAMPEEETSPEGASMEHGTTYKEWKRKEKEKPVGYDNGPYWQFLLAHASVPVIGISEVADSELACFSNDYPWAGYIVHHWAISKCMFSDIVQTPSIPVWIKWAHDHKEMTMMDCLHPSSPCKYQLTKGRVELWRVPGTIGEIWNFKITMRLGISSHLLPHKKRNMGNMKEKCGMNSLQGGLLGGSSRLLLSH